MPFSRGSKNTEEYQQFWAENRQQIKDGLEKLNRDTFNSVGYVQIDHDSAYLLNAGRIWIEITMRKSGGGLKAAENLVLTLHIGKSSIRERYGNLDYLDRELDSLVQGYV